MIKIQKLKKADIIMIIVVLILIVINLILYVKEIGEPQYIMKQIEKHNDVAPKRLNEPETVEIPKTEGEIIRKLSTMNERERMEYYCGQYFKLIEKKDYSQAYDLLYTEFKQNYFPTLEEYENYVKEFYPSNFALEYEDITRQGDIYVLKLKVLDVLGSRENEKSQRIVLKENYYNDFVISFQVASNENKDEAIVDDNTLGEENNQDIVQTNEEATEQ